MIDITKNLVGTHIFKCWLKSLRFMEVNSKPLYSTIIMYNPTLLLDLSVTIIHKWQNTGIQTVQDLYKDGKFMDFKYVSG